MGADPEPTRDGFGVLHLLDRLRGDPAGHLLLHRQAVDIAERFAAFVYEVTAEVRLVAEFDEVAEQG
ncbi:MAG: hypothetical protein ABI112_17040 [Terracoccus sp.]